MSRRLDDISTSWRTSAAGIFDVLDCTRIATLITRSPMRSRSVVDFRLESNWRARASFTRVMAAGNCSSIWRSIRSSSCSHSLMARKAMRDELVSRSRTLNAASRAIRHAFSARRARSSAPRNLGSAGVLAGRRLGSASSPSGFRGAGVFRGIGRKVRRPRLRRRYPSSLAPKCEKMVTTFLQTQPRHIGRAPQEAIQGEFVNVADYLRRQFAYDEWANREVLNAIRAASGSNQRSLQLMSHIFAAEQLWLDRL